MEPVFRDRLRFSALAASVLALTVFGSPITAFGAPGLVSANVCSACHSRLYKPGEAALPNRGRMPTGMGMMYGNGAMAVDPASIAPYALWSASMMAHSVRDPYWRAKVRFETTLNPKAAGAIEDTCLSCHAPMQQYQFRGVDRAMKFDDLTQTGLEGVSCTVCHQIAPESLGSKESFTAGFKINGAGEIYGPHRNPFPMPMRMHTGLTPTFSTHVMESVVCGSCHTVITPVLDSDGKKLGEFLEQATYLEWLASSHSQSGKTCQSCHLPELTDGSGNPARQYIAHTPHGGYFGPTRPRTPFGRHFFQGANAIGLEMLGAMNLGQAEVLHQGAERARKNVAASLSLHVSAKIAGPRIVADVRLLNHTGHKLPTGFPSRRLWLHVRLTDATGKRIFESGAYDATSGEINGLGAQVAAHRDVVERPDQVAVYEAVMGASDSAPTASLMRASRFVKDNRLLPIGFDAARAALPGMESLTTAPVGVGDDSNFSAGADTVSYRIDAGNSPAPWNLTVEALYQSIMPSHVAAFDVSNSQEEWDFLKLVERMRGAIVAGRRVVVIE